MDKLLGYNICGFIASFFATFITVDFSTALSIGCCATFVLSAIGVIVSLAKYDTYRG